MASNCINGMSEYVYSGCAFGAFFGIGLDTLEWGAVVIYQYRGVEYVLIWNWLALSDRMASWSM